MLTKLMFEAGADVVLAESSSPWPTQLAGVALVSLIGVLALLVLVGTVPSICVLLARSSTSVQREEARRCLHLVFHVEVLIIAALVSLSGGSWSDLLAAGSTAATGLLRRGGGPRA